MRKPSEKQSWGIEKRIGPATAINFVQLITVIWLGSAFYTQTNERFANMMEQRKLQGEQMLELQKTQNQLLVQMTSVASRMDATTETLKDVRDALRKR